MLGVEGSELGVRVGNITPKPGKFRGTYCWGLRVLS